MTTEQKIKRYFLRKQGTNMVWQRNAELAGQADMIPISEELAYQLMKQSEVEQKARAAARKSGNIAEPNPVVTEKELQQRAGLIPPDEKAKAPKTIETMNELELRVLAVKEKIEVSEGIPLEEIRKLIHEAIATGGSTQETLSAANPDGLDIMTKDEIIVKAKTLGLKATGRKEEIIARIRQSKSVPPPQP